MEAINVLIIASLDNECLRQIAAVSPRINVLDSSHLWDVKDIFARGRKEDFSTEKFESLLAQAEVIYAQTLPENVIVRASRLKWIQYMFAGVNRILTDEIVQSRVTLTSTSGIHSTPVGEMTLELMIMLAKRAPLCFHNQQQKKWERFSPMLLRGKTVGIIGLGHIGREVARLAQAFGMRVIATRRSAKRVTRARYVDKLVPRELLPELLAESDFVVLILPSTAETHKLIGEKELKAMKSTAYLINVGRGATLDEEALVRALEAHWIAGAGLDAHTIEPLPASSNFWDMPNVIITPHVGGVMEDHSTKATALFCENLRRYISGKRLRNIVNKKRGYYT